MSHEDKTLTCIDCGTGFVFTAGEQQFYQERGFDHEPRRCRTCRTSRKSAGGGAGGAPSRPDSGSPVRSSGARGYSGGPGSGRGEREFFDAICSACGGTARLPFQPSADRPVYCRSCFQGRSGPGGSR